MKRHLLPLLLLLAGVAGLPTLTVQAQDKPVLNTAPPGLPPPPTRPVPVDRPPAPEQEPAPVAPTPAQEPVAQPSPDRPSGLDLPGTREARAKAAEAANTKMFVYTGFSLGYTSYFAGNAQVSQFVIGASPAIGYRINDRLSAGPGISYTYSNYSVDYGRNNGGGSLQSNNFGVKAFAQYRVYDQFFIHGEYELTRARVLEYDASNNPTGGKLDRTIESPLAGLGYRQQFSDRAAGDILLLYNFNDTFESLYPNPVIRFNFLFNFGR